MKSRKLLCVILVICMVAVVFAGCGSQQTPATNPPATQAPANDPTNAPATQAPEAPPPADDTVYKFNVSFAAPEFSATGITAALDRIQEASNGRIEFTYYYSWSITSVPTCIDDLNAGVVDICAVPFTEHLNLFPYTNLVSYTPFLGMPNMFAVAEIYDELYAEYPVFEEEFTKNGLVYWTNFPCPGYNIYTTSDKEIRVPDDLNGLKLISSSSMMQQFIAKHGGAAVSTPVTEYATSLNTNVVDGAINHSNVLRGFGCIDFIKGATIFGEQGTALSILAMVFSQEAWDSLPADLQQLFKDEATTLRDEQAAWDNEANNGNVMAIQGAGGNVITLTDDEIQVWRDAFADILDDYIAQLIADGATEAQAIYDAVQAKIAAY